MALTLSILFILVSSSNAFDVGERKDVIHMTSEEKDKILDAIYLMKTVPSRFDSNYTAWDYYGWVHGEAFKNITHIYGHNRWSFLPWHRAFSYILEEEMRYYMNDSSIYLPYWDPSNELSTYLSLYDTEFLGGNGDESSNPPFLLPPDAALGCNNFQIDPSLNAGLNATGIGPMDNYTCLARRIGVNSNLPPPGIL